MFHPDVIQAKKERFEWNFLKAQGRDFRFKEYPIDEVDFYLRSLEDAYGPDGQPLRALTPNEDAFVFNELNLSALDYRYWAERYAYILTDRREVERLVLRGSQKKIVAAYAEEEKKQWAAGRPYVKLYFIISKARQLGASVVCQTVLDNMVFLNNGMRALIASDHDDNSAKLWDVSMLVFDSLPVWMRPPKASRKYAEFLRLEGLGSHIKVGQGNMKTTMGQAGTSEVIHFTEVSSWEFPEQIDADVLPSFNSSRAPLSIFMLESTGAGMGDNWFFEQCNLADEGRGVFKHIFVAWWLWEDKFTMDSTGVALTDQTKAVATRVKADYNFDMSKDQLAWYQVMREQYESKGDLETFLQEHPTFEEEAFQAGAPHVFPYSMIETWKKTAAEPLDVFQPNIRTGRLKEDKDPTNKLLAERVRIWDYRRPGATYTIGVDPTTGVGKDNAGVFVNLVGTKGWVDEQVAEYWGIIDPEDLANIVKTLGHMYADDSGFPARVIIEINPAGGGLTCLRELMRAGYPNLYVNRKLNVIGGGWSSTLGWWTTAQSRPLLTDMGTRWLKLGQWRIHSKRFFSEAWTFLDFTRVKGRRHLEHAPGSHDDLLFAGFLALYAAHEDDIVSLAESKVREFEDKKAARERVRPDLRDVALEEDVTWEEAWDLWRERRAFS